MQILVIFRTVIVQFCVLKGKKEIRVQHNTMIRHPRNITIHAEVRVCQGIPKSKLRGATLFVFRVRADGSYANSRPCEDCQKFIKKMGISRVYYSI